MHFFLEQQQKRNRLELVHNWTFQKQNFNCCILISLTCINVHLTDGLAGINISYHLIFGSQYSNPRQQHQPLEGTELMCHGFLFINMIFFSFYLIFLKLNCLIFEKEIINENVNFLKRQKYAFNESSKNDEI